MGKKVMKEYAIITVGFILLAISLQYFYYPNEIVGGGVSGLALVVNSVTGMSPSLFMNIANIILFMLAFILVGGEFGGKSIYASFGTSITLWVLEKFIPPFVVTDNLLLATIFGSVVGAFGIALVFSQNASTGGTDILAKILNKYIHLDIGKAFICVDFIVIIFAIFVFGIDKALFGLIGVYLMGTLIDKVIEGFNNSKQLIIISNRSDEISKVIIEEIDRGCTKILGTGAYSNKDLTVLYVVVSRKEFLRLKMKIKEIDPKAFFVVSEAAQVFGEGFGDLVEM